MAINSVKKLSLSKESAQLLLKGLKFFQESPQAKDWHGLDKDIFFLLVRDIAQFYPNEKENLAEYLVRLKSFLQQIINNEELAPSIPQNLEELVAAFEAFQKEKDAEVKTKEVNIPTSQDVTLEDWIKNLQERHTVQRIEREVEKKAVFVKLPEQQEKTIKETLVKNIVAVVPRSIIPNQEEQKIATERVRNVLDQNVIKLALKETEPLAKQISKQIRFLTVPPAAKPPASPEEQNLGKAVIQAVKDKIPVKNPDRIQKIAQKITQELIQKVPKLTIREKDSLTEMEKITLTEEVVNASLPEIVSAIAKPPLFTKTEAEPPPIATGIKLNPKESQEFLRELTGQVKQPLLNLSTFLQEELKLEKDAPSHQVKSNQEGVILNQFKENPLLPYRLVPQENQTPLATQMRQVVDYHGINPKSAEIIGYQNEEVAGLTNSIIGKTSPWWQNQTNLFRARGENQDLIDQTATNLDLQIRFEANFPQLKSFYQEATAWPQPPNWLSQITNPITSLFKNKLGNLWENTAIAKGVAEGAKSKASLFFKKTLGSFSIFTGAKKAFQEGAKRGATKAVTWLAKKLAATKLGAALGSIAPGIGNAVGAIIGFGVDIIKGGLNLFSNTLQKITGGETEAEQAIKANLGPLGKIAFSPITLIIVGAPILILVLALGLFQIEGSAFILDEEAVSGLPFPNLPSEEPIASNHFAERLVQILQECPATKPNGYINKNNFPQVAQCLEKAGINSSVIDILRDSVNRFSSLQCVGFVRAVEASSGRTLPGCGNAKDYANCSAVKESDIYQYADCKNLKIGAIGISTGGTYGHVGIVTNIENPENGIARVRFASAWGTGSTDGGRVTITTLPCDSFAAFIQTKN
jgi:surface antigen